ncbi:Arylsulfatase [Hondaea fermentalgiana]|uniref:Arylsulfatase n=1 Tax=Hondaea fermentalgiana TaxID=2315210 RepID=A0A2R5GP41_9STRA|nr:Arylsulfatase [Hondaea fermentalgiana]|eukprot:GBG30081.1 Arylsulfatase [Hondaea fermentalgiana]
MNGKRSLFEGGQRVSFIMQWPNMINSGQITNNAINQIDLIATLAEMTGAILNDCDAYDSHSFYRAVCDLAGVTPAQVRGNQPMVTEVPEKESGDGLGERIRCGSQKMLYAEDQWWMFDLVDDPSETTNIMDENLAEFASLKGTLYEVIDNSFSDTTAVYP